MSQDPSRGPAEGRDGGFTLIELLVAMTLLTLLGSIVLSFVLTSTTSAQNAQVNTSLTDQARVSLNRLARELRQARSIDAVHPTGVGSQGLTVSIDFNGNGAIEPTAVDPEQLTYCLVGKSLSMRAGTSDCTAAGFEPVTNAVISTFTVEYLSSHTANGAGLRTWQQLDAAGNANGLLDSTELARVDSLRLTLVAKGSGHTQNFQTTVDLRNR